MKSCKICKSKLQGRRDKIFCSITCKNYYHVNLRRVTRIEAQTISRILHRNRSILLEVMGKNKSRKKVSRQLLDKKKFNFKYHTHLHVNSKKKTFYYIYDFAYMEFSDDEVLITRKSEPEY